MRNPELIRNVWLELTPHRLVITPIVLIAIVYIALQTTNPTGAATTCKYIFLFFAFIWGTRAASDAVCEEVNNRTWDWQRTSQLSPTQMSIGKLFGSTCFAWYGAGLALLGYWYFGNQTYIKNLGFSIYIYVIGAILTHAITLVISLEALNLRRENKVRSFTFFVLGLIAGGLLTNYATLMVSTGSYIDSIQWYQSKYSNLHFACTSLTLFCAWSLIGLFRQTRIELQYKNIPWVFALFVLYCMIYVAGFVDTAPLMHIEIEQLEMVDKAFANAPIFAAFTAAGTITYIAFISDKLSSLGYHKLISAFTRRSLIKGLEHLPKWSVAFALTFLAGLWFSITTPNFQEMVGEGTNTFRPSILAFSILLLMARDGLLIHYFRFDLNAKRPTLTILFYLFVLYVIVPWILSILNLWVALAWFRPGVGLYPVASIAGPAVQALIIGYFVVRRWQSQTRLT